MKDLRPTRGEQKLRAMIAEGEHVHQDFKFTISDARKIARSLSAFANNDGGRLLIGVKDNGTIAGVRNEEDVFVVEEAAGIYCRPALTIEFEALKAKGGLEVIVAKVERQARRPVYASDSPDHWRAYYRVADENIAAHELMVDAWEREAEGHSTALSALHHSILAAIEEQPRALDLRDLAISVHASAAAVREAVIELANSSLIDFSHNGSNFMLTIK